MGKFRMIVQGFLLAIPLSDFALSYFFIFLADTLAPAPISEWLVLFSVGFILIFPILSCSCGLLGIVFSSHCLYKRDSKVVNIVWVVLFVMLILVGVFYVGSFWDGAASV